MTRSLPGDAHPSPAQQAVAPDLTAVVLAWLPRR
jgi:hypothetical protein